MAERYLSEYSVIQAVGDVHPLDYNAQGIVERIKAIPAADVVERPRWIPVTERLPGDDRQVLAYYGFDHGDGYLGMMFMQVLDWFGHDPKPHFQHEGLNGMKVTHWMPLPEPPEDAP